MSINHDIVNQVYQAQEDLDAADDLIRAYLPYIKSQVSKYTLKFVDDTSDELSIGLMAFHEAINSYSKLKGAFLSYASLSIKSRLIDYSRSQIRHQGMVSLDQSIDDEEDISLMDTIPSKHHNVDEYMRVQATQAEIEEFKDTLSLYDLDLEAILEAAPKQDRTLVMCHEIISYINVNPEILDAIESTHKLPITLLANETSVPKKTIEGHRKYILGMTLVLTNGFIIMRDHLEKVIYRKGGMRS